MKKAIILFLICAGLAVNAQNPDDYCSLTLVLKGDNGAVLTGQKFKMLSSSNELIVELITDAAGKSSMKLKKNSTYNFEATIAGRTVTTKIPVGGDNRFTLELQMAASTEAPKDVKTTLHVTDDKGIPETQTKLSIVDGKDTIFSCITDLDGLCKTDLKRAKNYSLIAEKFGKTFNIALNIPNDPDLAEFTFDLKIKVIDKIVRSYVLDNVYFDYNKWNIKPESDKALNELYDMMNANPKVTVEVGGHTDSDGDDQSNMRLSQHRADAVKQYVVSKGIRADRIITKGYGETTPIATNATPEGKAKNRRTEVKVITE